MGQSLNQCKEGVHEGEKAQTAANYKSCGFNLRHCIYCKTKGSTARLKTEWRGLHRKREKPQSSTDSQ